MSTETIVPCPSPVANRDQVTNELGNPSDVRFPASHQPSRTLPPPLHNPGNGEAYPIEAPPQEMRLGVERLLNAREVAESLGVSERWVRDHTTRRSPRIRGIKLGWLMRYRRADVETFMKMLDTLPPSRPNRFRV